MRARHGAIFLSPFVTPQVHFTRLKLTFHELFHCSTLVSHGAAFSDKYYKAGQKILSLAYLNKREMDDNSAIFQHNHRLRQYTIYSDFRVIGCL